MSKKAQILRQEQIARERGLLGPEEARIKTTASYEAARAMNEQKPVTDLPTRLPPYFCAGCPERGHAVTHNGLPGKCVDGRFWSNGELSRMKEIKVGYGDKAMSFMTGPKMSMFRELFDLDYASAEVHTIKP